MCAQASSQLSSLFGDGFYEDPYPTYAHLRLHDPVLWDEKLQAWVLTRYSDVSLALSDPRFRRARSRMGERKLRENLASTGRQHLMPLHTLLANMMIFSDPPKHTRLRALIAQAFTPRVVEAMRPAIQRTVDSLLDSSILGSSKESGSMEVIEELAYPLPVIVICELLGLPVSDRVQLKQWSDDIVAFSAGVKSEKQAERALKSVLELDSYLRIIIERHRHDPASDLLGALVTAEESGDSLTGEELLATIVLLLMNGHETTTYMIGNALLALLRHPQVLEELRDDPSLMRNAVEEFLRYDGSVQLRGLGVGEDLELGGKNVRVGDSVFAVIAAANRDPEQYDDADLLDIHRRPNKHLDFGRGPHFCVGAVLARMELEISLNSLLSRLPGLELADEALEWQQIPVFRGLRRLVIRTRSGSPR